MRCNQIEIKCHSAGNSAIRKWLARGQLHLLTCFDLKSGLVAFNAGAGGTGVYVDAGTFTAQPKRP